MQDDSLMTALGTFRTFATERRIPEITGYMDEEAGTVPRIVFIHDVPSDADDPNAEVRAFIRCIEGLDIRLVVVLADRLTESECQAALDVLQDGLEQLDEAEAADQDVAEARSTFKHWLADVKEAETHIGQIAMLSIRAITRDPVTVIEWLAVAPWQDAVINADERVGDLLENVTEDDGELGISEEERVRRDEWNALEQERRMWPAKRRTEAARQLAEAPDFGKAKREADRVYLLRKLLGDAAPSDDYLLKEISREAFAIYRLEIAKKP